MLDATMKRQLEDCLSALTASNCPFDDWEREFLQDMRKKYEQWGGQTKLTDKQRGVINRCWDKI
jgi:hypothetical protein